VLVDLLEGLEDTDRPAVLLSSTEAPDPVDARLGAVLRWTLHEGIGVEAVPPPDATHLFVLLDGARNPIDQLEAWSEWLEGRALNLARALCVVNCALAERHPKLVVWYEACIHFSDVVLLARRDGVSNKWIGEFRRRFEDQYFPCLFEFVKGGRVANPALVLTPEARRMSHAFDEPEWTVVGEEDEHGEESSGEEEVEVTREVDPYFERRNGGRRMKEIPDIREFLKPGA
jgi:hypothetical protein